MEKNHVLENPRADRRLPLFDCDVIFMAPHGRNGLHRLFIGSEMQKVLTHSTIPVMVFH
jgi:nucleotide-binding universal stress UspA family protein